ncbi:methyltransferase family protein [Nitratireductor rhodophyticola]|uniref:methyltransferase family protein n=1 Tax=Nitratireductor rhodophyticola TaxID=2854036 RepID=UPI0008141A17
MNATYISPGMRIALSRSFAVLLFVTLGLTMNAWSRALPLLEHTLSLIGWVLIAVAVVGRVWCSAHINGRKNAELVIVGPYSLCRNPLYFCSFIGGLGVMLVTETLLLPLVFCVLFGLYYSHVIDGEEKTLLKRHDAAFQDYRARVPRFWPQFNLFTEPNSYRVSAANFRKSLGDAMWFIIAGGVIEFLEGLHAAGFLPTLLRVY